MAWKSVDLGKAAGARSTAVVANEDGRIEVFALCFESTGVGLPWWTIRHTWQTSAGSASWYSHKNDWHDLGPNVPCMPDPPRKIPRQKKRPPALEALGFKLPAGVDFNIDAIPFGSHSTVRPVAVLRQDGRAEVFVAMHGQLWQGAQRVPNGGWGTPPTVDVDANGRIGVTFVSQIDWGFWQQHSGLGISHVTAFYDRGGRVATVTTHDNGPEARMRSLSGNQLDWAPSAFQPLIQRAHGPVRGVTLEDGATWTIVLEHDERCLTAFDSPNGFATETGHLSQTTGIHCSANHWANIGPSAGVLVELTVGLGNTATLYAKSKGSILAAAIKPMSGMCPLITWGPNTTGFTKIAEAAGDTAVVSVETGRDAIIACNVKDGSTTIPLGYMAQPKPGAAWPQSWETLSTRTPKSVSAIVQQGKVRVVAVHADDTLEIIQQT